MVIGTRLTGLTWPCPQCAHDAGSARQRRSCKTHVAAWGLTKRCAVQSRVAEWATICRRQDGARACHFAVEPGAGLPADRAPPGPSPAAPPDAGDSLRGSSATAMARSRSPTYCASSASTACADTRPSISGLVHQTDTRAVGSEDSQPVHLVCAQTCEQPGAGVSERRTCLVSAALWFLARSRCGYHEHGQLHEEHHCGGLT